ncbi:MAG: DNA polymerase I [Actinomycetaceae bacterium]|nr:DNA polymerase I [Actinomycetaceae bacterium]
MSKQRLLILDGHSLAFRAFYAMDPANFMTSHGTYTNAIYGFTSMLTRMITAEQPTHIAVAFDVSRRSFRTDIYPEYKGGRGETPEEFKGQVELIEAVLEAMGIVTIKIDNIEADDILATLAYIGTQSQMEVLVSSGDRDTFQLINDHVTVLYPGKSIVEPKRMDAAAVEERYGVRPAQYPEIAALTGEKADNLPGVPGVGEKTAAQWIVKYGGLDALLENSAQIPGKRGEALREHIEDVRRNRHLNALLTDIDLPMTLADLLWRGVSPEKVRELFDTLEFNRLREQVIKLKPYGEIAQGAADLGVGEDVPAMEAVKIQHWDRGAKNLQSFFETLTSPVGVVVRGEVHLPSADLMCLAVGDATHCLVIDPHSLSPEDDLALAAWLSDEAVAKIVKDAKYCAHVLQARGWGLRGLAMDVDLADYLLQADAKRESIAELEARHLERIRTTQETKVQLELDLDGLEDIDQGLGDDCRALVEMYEVLLSKMEQRCASDLWRDVEVPTQEILTRMECVGIAADVVALEGVKTDLRHIVNRAEEQAFASIDREVNLSSPKQLQDVLFNQLKMPPTRKTKTGYTTNAQALEELSVTNPHPFLTHLLEHRDAIKLKQITTTLLEKVGTDGRIHTTFLQTNTATGRLASVEPNLQNIPARTSTGRRLREGFIAGEGFDLLMTADYSQIEMRIMAHLSQDEGLIAAFNSGEDLHKAVAALVYGVPAREVTAEQRSQVKATSYGLAYGLSAFGLAAQLKITQHEARQLMDMYFSRFGRVRAYLDSVVGQATKDGYTQTMFGRRRYLPDLRSTNRQRQEIARRAALNAPIQGSAADLIKIAMIEVDRRLRAKKCSSRLVLQVHDELVLEVTSKEAAEVQNLVEDSMGGAAQLSVPLAVSVGTGKNWREAAH